MALGPGLAGQATLQTNDGGAWWTVFGDSHLDHLIEVASHENLSVQQATLRIAESRAQRDVAASKFYPSVSGSADAARARTSPNGISKALSGGGGSGPAPPSTFDIFQVGFDATWELDLFGKTRRNVEAADADIRASEAALAGALISVQAEIVRVYFTLRGDQKRRDIALADLTTQQRLESLVSSRNRSGLAPDSDVASQRVRVASSQALVPPLDQDIAQNMNRLSLLLAMPPGAVSDMIPPAPLPVLPSIVPAGLPGDLLRRRPDIREREADLAAATARIGVARAAFFPNVTLAMTGGLQSTLASQLFDWSSRFLLGGGQLSVPIFAGGKLQAQLKLSELESQAAALAYREAVLNAFHDMDNALIAYAGDQQRAAALRTQLEGSIRSRDLALARYRSGLAAYIEVLDAQRETHQAEEALADATVAVATDLVAIYKALGGGWQRENQDTG